MIVSPPTKPAPGVQSHREEAPCASTSTASSGNDASAHEDGLARHQLAPLARWAFDYLTAQTLSYKLAPAALPPSDPGDAHPGAAVRLARPGRPPELIGSWDKYKAPKSAAALRDPKKRAHLLHTFFHHELQAAELMCWACLAFPDTPVSFRRGLLRICVDEVRHMNMYVAHIEQLGFEPGSFAVRDWFWQRVPAARTAAEFVAVMGLGFEAGNLDHSERYVAMFTEAGDLEAAALQATVGREELAHVAFGVHWFRALAGELDFARWSSSLPAPLSPMVMRGRPLAREARRTAGFADDFLDRLESWLPVSPGC